MTDSEKMDLILEKASVLDEKVSELDKKVSILDGKVSELETRTTRIELTLKNEMNRNIKIVAEEYYDLARKLNECVKIASDIKAQQEFQDICINMHESRLRA